MMLRGLTHITRLSSSLFEDLKMGFRPVINSRITTPKLKTSDFRDALPTIAYSGAKYPNVPSILAGELEQLVRSSVMRCLAIPRSVICMKNKKPQHRFKEQGQRKRLQTLQRPDYWKWSNHEKLYLSIVCQKNIKFHIILNKLAFQFKVENLNFHYIILRHWKASWNFEFWFTRILDLMLHSLMMKEQL